MDFALFAPDLPTTPLPPLTAAPSAPNGEWLLSWLAAAARADVEIHAELPALPTAAPFNTPATLIPERLFGENQLGPEEFAPAEASDDREVGEVDVAHLASLPSQVAEFSEETKEEEEEVEPSVREEASGITIVTTGTTWDSRETRRPINAASEPPLESASFERRQSQLSAEIETSPRPQFGGDKGEVIWEAELLAVETKAPPVSTPDAQPPQPEKLTSQRNNITSIESSRDSEPSRRDEKGSEERGNQQKPEAPTKEAPPREKDVGGSERPDPTTRSLKRAPLDDVGSCGSSLEGKVQQIQMKEEPALAPTAESGDTVTTVEPVSSAQRLRPTQVARVQVDIGDGGPVRGAAPSLRLVLTQRGDNVNVQLRSWNDSATPLAAADVQPLLDNLARQGLTASAERSVEGAAAIEAPKERLFVLSQPSAGQQDERGFQNPDQRQQRQQEQHRQQHELIARRQQSTGQAFDLQSVLDENLAR